MASKLTLSALFLRSLALGQTWSPPEPKGITELHSSHIKGASISYKKTEICSTPDTETYSGYVRLPPREDDAVPHPANLFFYYAKSNTKHEAPLTIYLSGGPGASSTSSMTTEIGPCSVNPDSNSTSANPWSWTRDSDILFIDQPTQTGFSYDVLTNATIDYSTTAITPADFDKEEIPAVNHTFAVGVFGSQDSNGTANSTENGARTLWDFMQVWLNEFPERKNDENKIHFWTESFGGRFGPAYSAYFVEQNEKIRDGQRKIDRVSSPSEIKLDTLSIHNGCSDIITQGSFYPEFAYNNTYGVQVITKEQYEEARNNFTKPGGCLEMAMECREQQQKYDPYNWGNNAEVNAICIAADAYCYENVLGAYALSGRDIHDMAEIPTSTFPQPYTDGFFNRAWVQEGLGAEVNFTANSNAVYNAFGTTGNALISRGNAMDEFAFLLERGVKVNLIHGDRDYLCNWMGGENITLSIKHKQSAAFTSSGYENLITNSTYTGGVVRQHGNLSFTRVFEAGHEAPAFQPETMYRVFSRIINSKDIATGDIPLTGESAISYRTRGPHSSFHIKNKLTDLSQPLCYTLDMDTTCTADQKAALLNGTAIVEDFIVQWP